MKRAFVFAILFLSLSTQAQFVTLADSIFSKSLQLRFPDCFNGQNELDTTCSKITTLTSLEINKQIGNVTNLDGIQYMDALENLECSFVYTVSHLPRLPKSLKRLSIKDNPLASLPLLHEGLKTLEIVGNKIGKLPILPSTLENLDCSYTGINELGDYLPKGLKWLNCYGNKLQRLPILPDSLKYLDCYENEITELPKLPNGLLYLYISYNKINCLPLLPDSLLLIILDPHDITCLPNRPANMDILDSAQKKIVIPVCNRLNDTYDCLNKFVVTNEDNSDVKEELYPMAYPNPSKGQIMVKSTGFIRIKNLHGQICFERQLSDSEDIDLNFLNAGIYLYQIDEGQLQKLVLHH